MEVILILCLASLLLFGDPLFLLLMVRVDLAQRDLVLINGVEGIEVFVLCE